MILTQQHRTPRAALPTPRFARTGIHAWRTATTIPLAMPPVAYERWTSLFNLLGPRLLLSSDFQGSYDLIDDEFLKSLHRELGVGPMRGAHRALLLTAPVSLDRSFVKSLRRLLRGDGYGVRQRAALVLGHLGITEAYDDLVRQLRDPDNDARRGATEALGLLGDPRAALVLAKFPWDENDDTVNAARFDAIDRLDAWSEVADALDHGTETASDRFALAAQAAVAEGETSELLELLAGSDTTWIRGAATIFSRRPHLVPESIDGIIAALKESQADEISKLNLAQAIGQCGESMIEHLGELMTSDNWEHKALACMAAACSPEIVAGLQDELIARLDPNEDSDVRREAALALLAAGVDSPLALVQVPSFMTRRYQCLARASDVTAPGMEAVAMLAGVAEPGFAIVPFLGSTSTRGDQADLLALLLALAEPELAGPLLASVARNESQSFGGDLRRYAAAGCLLTDHAPEHLGIQHRLLLAQGDREQVDLTLDEQPDGRAGALVSILCRDSELSLVALRTLRTLGNEALRPFRDVLAVERRRNDREDIREELAGLLGTVEDAPSGGSALAEILAPAISGSDPTSAFLRLQETAPAVALMLAREMVFRDNRTLARVTVDALTEKLDEALATDLLRRARSCFGAGEWVIRETACEVVGRIPMEFWPEGALDEVDEILRERVKSDDDNDVKNAARAALARLGREPVDETATDEETSDEETGDEDEASSDESSDET